MANFIRLIFSIFIVFLSVNAYATYPASVGYQSASNPEIFNSSLATVCTRVASVKGFTYGSSNFDGSYGRCYSSTGAYSALVYQVYLCGNQLDTSTNYTCAGDPPVTCPALGVMGSSPTKLTVSESDFGAGSTCYSGCSYKLQTSDLSVGLQNAQGVYQYYNQVLGVSNGANCTATTSTPTPVSPTPQEQCAAKGLSSGTINGAVVCVKGGTAGSQTIRTAPTSNLTSNTNSAGAVSSNSSSSTYTLTDNSVTTNTTVTAADGSKSTVQKIQDKISFCDNNPDISICKSTEFNGDCNAYQCNGDAIQCALTKRVHQARCDEQDAKNEIHNNATFQNGSDLVDNHLGTEADGFINRTGDNQKTVNIPTSLSETGSTSFSGAGIQDVTFTVMGKTDTLPLSHYQIYLEYMGYILVALTYLASYKLIMGGV